MAAESGLEVVFVSSDHTPEDMKSYMSESHGHWLAIEHGSDEAMVSNQLFSFTFIYFKNKLPNCDSLDEPIAF